MTIDPIASLAFAVYSQKGIYAILLGSGISRNAQIKTGWEITLDLISQLAVINKTPTADPESWYRETYKKEPDYAEVLNVLSGTGAERQRILSQYFEATAEEREINPRVKHPTEAHRAIAKLVSKGYIRVILTTNFDRLMERALEDEGIAPHVIVGDEGIDGRMPFAHAEPTVIKLHGDYKDTRLLNTPDELSLYTPKLSELLNEVLDTFGLLTCGWSAAYDKALEKAIIGCKSRRFSAFWTYPRELSDQAISIINFRKATPVKIVGADELFIDLLERVEALESLNQQELLSSQIAMARVKTYLQSPQKVISLHDLIGKESTKMFGASVEIAGERNFQSAEPEEKLATLKKIESISQPLLHMCAAAQFWGGDEDLVRQSLRSVLEKLASAHAVNQVHESSADVRQYPALLVFYACGVAALLRKDYSAIRFFAQETLFRRERMNDEEPLVRFVNTNSILNPNLMSDVGPYKNKWCPISWNIYDALRPAFSELFIVDRAYDNAFDEFEILTAAQYAYIRAERGIRGPNYWFCRGKFWSDDGFERVRKMRAEIDTKLGNWEPVVAGIFDKNIDTVKLLFDKLIAAQYSQR